MKNTEEFIYCGVQTFMGSPFVELQECGNYDVTMFGVPIDYGASYRRGSRLAPRAIRQHSFWDRVDGKKYHNFDDGKSIRANTLKIADVGDLNVWPANPEKNIENIVKTVRAIRQKSFPLIVGGDHSTTYANFIGCLKGLRSKTEPRLGLLHFDAHLDVEKDYLTLPTVWHGNPFRQLLDQGYLDGRRMVTIGPRGIVPQEWFDYAENNGITIITTNEVHRLGIESVMTKAIQLLKKSCDTVFVSIDIDCLDIAHAPGTGTPQANGLWAQELISAVRCLRGLPVSGLDLVEVNPELDATGATTVLAGDLLFNYLAFGFNK